MLALKRLPMSNSAGDSEHQGRGLCDIRGVPSEDRLLLSVASLPSTLCVQFVRCSVGRGDCW